MPKPDIDRIQAFSEIWDRYEPHLPENVGFNRRDYSVCNLTSEQLRVVLEALTQGKGNPTES